MRITKKITISSILIGVLSGALFFGMYVSTKPNPQGIFVGSYFGGTEEIAIDPSGTFRQEFRRAGGVVYASSGRWTLDGSMLTFHSFISANNGNGTLFGTCTVSAPTSFAGVIELDEETHKLWRR